MDSWSVWLNQWMRNPACSANELSVSTATPMSEVAALVGLEPVNRSSPFAIERARVFRESVLGSARSLLLDELHEVGMASLLSRNLLDLEIVAQEAGLSQMRYLASVLRNELGKEVPAGFTEVEVEVSKSLHVRATTTIDLLCCTKTSSGSSYATSLQLCSIVLLPERGGETDISELSDVRLRLGIQHSALSRALEAEGIESSLVLDESATIILPRAGTLLPMVRTGESVLHLSSHSTAQIQNLEALIAGVPPDLATNPDELRRMIADAPKAYENSCWSSCDLAEACRREEVLKGNPAVLGNATIRQLGSSFSLHRAIELLDDEAPIDPTEEELVRTIRAQRELLQ
jgi:hypothetical protein